MTNQNFYDKININNYFGFYVPLPLPNGIPAKMDEILSFAYAYDKIIQLFNKVKRYSL